MENNLPKRQLTFISGKLNITFRCDDKEEFKALMAEALSYVKAYEESNKVTPRNDVMAAHDASNPHQGDIPTCPVCGGEMWDNRPKKAQGLFSPASPNFKCKDKACSGVIWPPKK